MIFIIQIMLNNNIERNEVQVVSSHYKWNHFNEKMNSRISEKIRKYMSKSVQDLN